MSGTIDDRYFEWLYSHVGAVRNRNPRRSYWELLRQLYCKEFVWVVANDDNRVEDGKELRHEFLTAEGIDQVDQDWLDLGCSMLEMLVALSRRLEFEDGSKNLLEWFWTLISNIELGDFNDSNYDEQVREKVEDVLDCVIYRTYAPDGTGGLFPLQTVGDDQRKIEIWYQMSAYLIEKMQL